MDRNYVCDVLFDLLNESEELALADICVNDSNDGFLILGNDGSRFEIVCRFVEKKILMRTQKRTRSFDRVLLVQMGGLEPPRPCEH